MECTFKLVSKTGQPARASKIRLLFAEPRGVRVGFQGSLQSKTDTVKLKLHRKPDDPKMKIFFAADSYKPKIIENYAPKELTEIELEELSGGGSLVFSNAKEDIPDFGGFLEIEPHPSGRSIKINAYYININGGQTQPVDLNIGEFAILEDESGKKVRLSVISIIPGTNEVIIEYQHLLPSSDLPAESDDWEPLPIDRGNPLYEEVVETLEVATEAIRESNGYAASKKDERDEVVSNLEIGLANLKTEDTISSDKVEKIFYALKTAGKVFSRVTIEGGKISAAILSMMALAKAIWPWLPWLTVLPI